jgi:hypothetical protein
MVEANQGRIYKQIGQDRSFGSKELDETGLDRVYACM